MRKSLKSVVLSLLAVCFCFIGYSQSNGNLLVSQLLNEEKVESKDNTDLQNVELAMKILDDRKDEGKITEAKFQSQLNDLMLYKKELRDEMISAKMVQSKKNREAYLIKKKNGEVKDIFDISKDRLKVKLEKGKITQAEYDAKLQGLNERQAARKAKE